MRTLHISIPARIHLLGDPFNSSQRDCHALSAAIELRMSALIEPADGLRLERFERTASGEWVRLQHVEAPGLAPAAGDGTRAQAAALRRFLAGSAELRAHFERERFGLAVCSDLPLHSGLGGEALAVLISLVALREGFELNPHVHSDHFLAELAQRIAVEDLGLTCGYTDCYLPLFGGLAYVECRRSPADRVSDARQTCSYERLDSRVPSLPIVICNTGMPGVECAGGGQEQEASWCGAGSPLDPARRGHEEPEGARPASCEAQSGVLQRILSSIDSTAGEGMRALLAGDWEALGTCMTRNHQLLNRAVAQCGLGDPSLSISSQLVDAALEAGALGAKATDGWDGTTVCALVEPGEEWWAAEAFRQAARQAGLAQATIFVPRLAHQGLLIEERSPIALGAVR